MSYKTTQDIAEAIGNLAAYLDDQGLPDSVATIFAALDRLQQLEERHKFLMHWLTLYQFEGEAGNPGDRIICDYNCWHQELYQQMVAEGRLREYGGTPGGKLYKIPIEQLPAAHYCRVCKVLVSPDCAPHQHKLSCPVPYEPGGSLHG